MNARIVLFGLDESLASELHSVLANQQHTVHLEPLLSPRRCLDVVKRSGADLIFCSSEGKRYQALLEVVRRHKPGLPVVVVGRTPEVTDWLDAIEAGASDYCTAPFEPGHIHWILDSTLKHHSSASLYRAAS
jgi:DNA-binding NtrC family response regulator